MNFRIGQRVVHAFPDNSAANIANRIATGMSAVPQGQIYTVRSIFLHGIRLEEIINPIHPHLGVEYAYDSACFRPAVEPSIEIFTAMLSKTPKENRRAARRPRVKEVA